MKKNIFLIAAVLSLAVSCLYDPGKRNNPFDPGATPYGSSWKLAAANPGFAARYQHSVIVYNNKLWIVGGKDSGGAPLNDVWSTPDGTNWSQTSSAAFGPTDGRYLSSMVVYNGKMWLIAGYTNAGFTTNDVWNTSDGVTWTQVKANAAFTKRGSHASVVYNNRMWIIGGQAPAAANDVWWSTDGLNWTQATAAANFSGRYFFCSEVYDSKMWVIGGRTAASSTNDVWYSTDGANWTAASTGAPFAERFFSSSFVYSNRLFLCAGYSNVANVIAGDSWCTADGSFWANSMPSGAFGKRRGQTTTVFKGKIWLIAGATNNAGDLCSEVWWGE